MVQFSDYESRMSCQHFGWGWVGVRLVRRTCPTSRLLIFILSFLAQKQYFSPIWCLQLHHLYHACSMTAPSSLASIPQSQGGCEWWVLQSVTLEKCQVDKDCVTSRCISTLWSWERGMITSKIHHGVFLAVMSLPLCHAQSESSPPPPNCSYLPCLILNWIV